jgi:hypothetical protein
MSPRIQSQFEHLAETLFAGFEHDLGERALGAATGLDGDLDMFAAALGLAKTAVEGIMHDEGVESPLRQLYDVQLLIRRQTLCSTPAARTSTRTSSRRCRARLGAPRPRRRSRGPLAAMGAGQGVDDGFRKLSKRLEELVADSSALRPHVLPRLHGIAERVPELTDFAISVCSTPSRVTEKLLISTEPHSSRSRSCLTSRTHGAGRRHSSSARCSRLCSRPRARRSRRAGATRRRRGRPSRTPSTRSRARSTRSCRSRSRPRTS